MIWHDVRSWANNGKATLMVSSLCPLAFYPNFKIRRFLDFGYKCLNKPNAFSLTCPFPCIQNHALLLGPVNQIKKKKLFFFSFKKKRQPVPLRATWMITKKRAGNWAMVLVKQKSKCHDSSDWSIKSERDSKHLYNRPASYPRPYPCQKPTLQTKRLPVGKHFWWIMVKNLTLWLNYRCKLLKHPIFKFPK